VLIWAAADRGTSSGDGIEIVALVLAVLSLVIAAAALGWQIASWLLEAGRVRVQLRVGGLARTTPASSRKG